MDKRYQVFVSSTYADLKEERQKVIQTLMEMDCIPSGMELFPATDEEQWEFIKKVIDDCDYYLLIIGGRYGSVTSEGISYTEKEYDYAIDKGIKVIAFIHQSPEGIPISKSEMDPALQLRLKAFKEKVTRNRLVKFWRTAEELPGLVALSLTKTIKMFPAVGWIRADKASNTQLLNELNELRKRKEELEQKLGELPIARVPFPEIPDIASIEESVEVFGSEGLHYEAYWKIDITWRELFALVSPYLNEELTESKFNSILAVTLYDRTGEARGSYIRINDQIYQTIKIQLQVLGFIESIKKECDGNVEVYWRLTNKGFLMMISTRVHRASTVTTDEEDDELPF